MDVRFFKNRPKMRGRKSQSDDRSNSPTNGNVPLRSLRQVSGIKYVIKMSGYNLTCENRGFT